MAHGDAREGKWRENWWMEWVPFTLPRNMVYPALQSLMRTPRLPVVDWTDAPAGLNGLVRFAERRNLVSERVPSHFNWSLLMVKFKGLWRGGFWPNPKVLWRKTTMKTKQSPIDTSICQDGTGIGYVPSMSGTYRNQPNMCGCLSCGV